MRDHEFAMICSAGCLIASVISSRWGIIPAAILLIAAMGLGIGATIRAMGEMNGTNWKANKHK